MSNEKTLRPIASVRTYPTDANNVICLALTDTNGSETEFVINPEGRVLWSDIAADPFMDIDFLIKESLRLLKLHAAE